MDVRSKAEYAGGHVGGSLNIPLHELPNRVEEFRMLSQPIQLYCAIGNRSGQATAFLKSHGIESTNAGSWLSVSQNTES